MRCADCRAFVSNKSSRVGDGVCHLIPPTPIFMGFMQPQPIPGLLSGKNIPSQPILQPVRPSMAPDDFCMQFQPRPATPEVLDTSEHDAAVLALQHAAEDALIQRLNDDMITPGKPSE